MKVAFLVNGGPASPMAERARAFATRLSGRFDIVTAYRSPSRIRSISEFLALIHRERPHVCYVFDVAYSGIAAALFAKMFWRTRVVVDTGDAIYELARSVGARGRVALGLTWLLEQLALRAADRIVVRGTRHRTLLLRRGLEATVIQDGVDTEALSQASPGKLRERLQHHSFLSVGVLGSLTWSERLQMGYGWDLIEALRLLKDVPIKGVVIGTGSALPILKARAAEYGLGDRLLFVDPVPYEELPGYLAAVDVWLSTQTNDIPGNVRTTGKLPLYLAAGKYILASDVGEASLVLPPEMRVEYHGVVDRAYPARLAERLRDLAAHPDRLEVGKGNIDVARSTFDYDVLSGRLGEVISSLE